MGVFVRNGIIYGGGGGSGEAVTLSQAEYNALSQTEKNDLTKVYYITDADGSADVDLTDLSDVAITSPSNGQVIAYDSTSHKWKNVDASLDVWSPVVSCLAGATSVTFDDIEYNASWCYDLYCDDGTGTEIPKESIVVNTSTDNSVTVTFASALANATQCKLHYWTA